MAANRRRVNWDFSVVKWSSNSPSIRMERSSETGRVTALWHPSSPYTATIDLPGSGEALFLAGPLFTSLAYDYITRVNKQLAMDWMLPGLMRDPIGGANSGPEYVRWFGFSPPSGRGDLCGSFVVNRVIHAGELDRTLVLLAGNVLPPIPSLSFPAFPLLGGQGLRVVLHWLRNGSQVTLRITGMAVSLPAVFARSAVGTRRVNATVTLAGALKKAQAEVAATHGLDPKLQVLVEFGVQVEGGNGAIKAHQYTAKTAPTSSDPGGYGYSLQGLFDVASNPLPGVKVPLTAHAVDAKLFNQDPASMGTPARWAKARPSLPNDALQALLPARRTTLPDLKPQASVPFKFSLTHRYFTVCQCLVAGDDYHSVAALAPKELVASAPQQGANPVCDPAVRSNEFAALSAYLHASEFFNLMGSFGLDPVGYFTFAAPALNVFYRDTLSHGAGRTGNVVNAEVTWSPKWQLGGQQPGNVNPGTLGVHYALADLTASPGGSPLGIAIDPRWSWHEFGHVLIAAATGELEFPFAHSIGDALAAILHDPDSMLATNPGWRGQTFPWVLGRRRHDRRARDGWSWSGAIFRRERTYFTPPDRGRNQYWAEQILSSTLFRLYRVVGGDASDPAARRDAAEFVAYLIMRAVKLLGPASVVPAATPAQFAAALMDADVGTGSFQGSGASSGRVGGAVHKAIRWTFDRQGLAEAAPGAVEICIYDRLATAEVNPISYDPASYAAPAQVLWVRRPGVFGLADQSPKVGEKNRVWVNVVNRGTSLAKGVGVEVWCAPLSAGQSARWLDGSWVKLTTQGAQPNQITGGQQARVGPFIWQPAAKGDYAILAVATCPSDPANVDPASGLPVSVQQSDMRWLAALDDNLAFRITTVK